MRSHKRDWLRCGWLAGILGLLLVGCAMQTPALTPGSAGGGEGAPAALNKMGIHLLLDDGRTRWPAERWEEHLQEARKIVGAGGYVAELIRGDDLDPARWQLFFDFCAKLELKPIVRFATVYDTGAGWWVAPTPDADGSYHTVAQQYADFVKAVQWPGKEHYVVIGNEPNHGNEWGGRPDPAAYARFLRDTAQALRLADPQVKILNAGLDPYTPNTGSLPFTDGLYYMDEESFLDGMVAAYPDVFTFIDYWNSHSYPTGPFSEPPWVQSYQVDWINDATNPNHITPTVGIYNRGINGYEWELFKLSTYGVSPLPVMIVETGWRHSETADPAATDQFGAVHDIATVGAYLDMACRGNQGRYPAWPEEGWTPWFHDARVVAVTPFALDGNPAEWGHTNWLQLDAEGKVLGTHLLWEP